jgi:hypothetical protein
MIELVVTEDMHLEFLYADSGKIVFFLKPYDKRPMSRDYRNVPRSSSPYDKRMLKVISEYKDPAFGIPTVEPPIPMSKIPLDVPHYYAVVPGRYVSEAGTTETGLRKIHVDPLTTDEDRKFVKLNLQQRKEIGSFNFW